MISGGRSTNSAAAAAVDSTKDDPFSSVSKLFKGTKYSQLEVQKALRNIAGNQATLKNMDGVTHQLQNSMGKRYHNKNTYIHYIIFTPNHSTLSIILH